MARRRPRRLGRALKPAEARGFAGAVISCVALVVYLTWAYVPDSVLASWGVTYYPSKEWAVTIPSFVLVSIGLALMAYSGANHLLVNAPGTREGISDKYSVYKARTIGNDTPPLRIPEISDLPITLVNNLLYDDG